MAINLAAQPSNAPLPSGKLSRVVGGGGASQGVAWPGGLNYFWANAPTYTIPMRTGPFNSPYRYFLCTNAYCIWLPSGVAWQNAIIALRLVGADAGTPINDLNGIQYFEQYIGWSGEPSGQWIQMSIEGKFYCEANQTYYVQFLSVGGAGNYWAGYQQHLEMMSYTIGDSVY